MAQPHGMRTIGLLLITTMISQVKAEELKAEVWKAPNDATVPYRWHEPESLAPGKLYPLVLFLHGAGEKGDDNQAQLKHGVMAILREAAKINEPCYLIAPQCPKQGYWAPYNSETKKLAEEDGLYKRLDAAWALVEKFEKQYPVDPDRIYVTGISMGGFGTWGLLGREGKHIAAAVPICGGGNPDIAKKFKNVPIWTFHGEADPTVSVDLTRQMVAALEKAGGKPKVTYYPGVGHDSWTQTYDNPEVTKWLFEQKK
ncbi:dienelactone hydrolase family protein [Luteolibacter pohnpeiensis]|uniref:Dienelactone hydrolase family protein n=1 Tax=Luteolibacter pohnpeiensis TaxID=454153 RepID=A0A934VQP5_9BACT|nr:dienelactone hydrolase family protein [Luteolibacter pohnpeiensis]MBK1882321.1 dienelactone hydrolase family protein [Luteolibacter pohnpeiensis]